MIYHITDCKFVIESIFKSILLVIFCYSKPRSQNQHQLISPNLLINKKFQVFNEITLSSIPDILISIEQAKINRHSS